MALARILTRAQIGIEAPLVEVEVHLSNGLPAFNMVGLPETVVKESKERVRSALLNAHYQFPDRRITINLAPADLPKEGGRYDLPIALGILVASEQLPAQALDNYEFAGELALSGALKPVSGILPTAIACSRAQRQLIVPQENSQEANLPNEARVFAANHLLEVCAHLQGSRPLIELTKHDNQATAEKSLDLADVKGQPQAKRALEIAACGQHNLLMIGPPGTGKTMLASRLPSILPPLTEDERLEVAAIASVSQLSSYDSKRLWHQRPFRAPHHTASGVALVGGGSNPKPGEVSLAHQGILFLDELGEFNRRVLDVLREPMESGEITISRASRQVRFPARFQLIAAMNPALQGNSQGSAFTILKSQKKANLSEPFLDRIDLHIEVPALPKGSLTKTNQKEESSKDIRQRICHARQRQLKRAGKTNAQLSSDEIMQACQLSSKNLQLLENAMDKLGLSARAYHRVLKVARSIADLENQTKVQTQHLTEALSYRRLDRKN